ncbi:hypothetical protein JFL43_20315 [Viridibacillus sp. YIM B01967]|uniref:Peptidase C-terminal archaeal/bacterial domain-containing protein n=1 Tax=Viridibacillus soli TaxID=2798301 RepID=A0ABS1HDS5_9BACL|nr:pre-peptidase C-terminal domain-containing protein [Viridibacillus soli]MBK3497133.1 hypothetical protein [Viridibacillus soli]
MKMMKYILTLIVMVTICLGFNSELGHAAEEFETIPLNKMLSKTLRIDSKKEGDAMYKVKIPKDGVVTLQLESPKNKEFSLFLLSSVKNTGEIKPNQDSPFISYAFSSKDTEYYKPAMTDTVGVKKGTYYVLASTEGAVKNVKFKVSFKAASNYEKENNNTIKTATPIKLGQAYKADIKLFDMKDYYKITAPKKTNIQITVKKQLKAPFTISLHNSKNQKINNLKMITSNNSLTHTGKVTIEKGTYYINVSSGASLAKLSVPYTIKVDGY